MLRSLPAFAFDRRASLTAALTKLHPHLVQVRVVGAEGDGRGTLVVFDAPIRDLPTIARSFASQRPN